MSAEQFEPWQREEIDRYARRFTLTRGIVWVSHAPMCEMGLLYFPMAEWEARTLSPHDDLRLYVEALELCRTYNPATSYVMVDQLVSPIGVPLQVCVVPFRGLSIGPVVSA